ncbi:MAG: YhjD/YihY/BrkB family envelope integrity protein [Eubacterium ventriosum]
MYTAQASFFIILSIFPFILLFFNLIGHASINQNTIIYLIHSYAPDSLKPLFVQVVSEIYEHVSSTAVSITAIAAIWSASKGVLSVMFGLYEIAKIHQKRNYFISRFVSMLYTIIFTVTLLLQWYYLFLVIALPCHITAPWLRQISIVINVVFWYSYFWCFSSH